MTATTTFFGNRSPVFQGEDCLRTRPALTWTYLGARHTGMSFQTSSPEGGESSNRRAMGSTTTTTARAHCCYSLCVQYLFAQLVLCSLSRQHQPNPTAVLCDSRPMFNEGPTLQCANTAQLSMNTVRPPPLCAVSCMCTQHSTQGSKINCSVDHSAIFSLAQFVSLLKRTLSGCRDVAPVIMPLMSLQ